MGGISLVGSIALRARALFGPAVEVHKLCYGRGHAAGGVTADTVIVRSALSPLAFQQRSDGCVGVVRLKGLEKAFAVGRRQLLQGLKALAVGFEQELQPFGGVEGIERCLDAVRQNGAHGFIAGHKDETIVGGVIEEIIRSTGLVRKSATFERTLCGGRESDVLFGYRSGSSVADVTLACYHRGDPSGYEEG